MSTTASCGCRVACSTLRMLRSYTAALPTMRCGQVAAAAAHAQLVTTAGMSAATQSSSKQNASHGLLLVLGAALLLPSGCAGSCSSLRRCG